MQVANCPYHEGDCIPINCPCAKYRAWEDAKDSVVRTKVLQKIFGNGVPVDKLELMMQMQKIFQIELSVKTGKPITNLSLEQLNDRMLMTERSIGDELAEIRKCLNWKDWKKPDWDKLRDLTEMKKEVIDVWHFTMNMFILLEMTPDEVAELYVTKNVENILRKKYDY